jgi:hypothetical protein
MHRRRGRLLRRVATCVLLAYLLSVAAGKFNFKSRLPPLVPKVNEFSEI